MMAESFRSTLWRMLANFAPAYRRTGAKIVYIADNFQQVRIKLPRTWQTRNHLNIIWGGSLYGALDPIYGVMLFKLLGSTHYYVVDKAATIQFLRPARATLYASFIIDDAELTVIRTQLLTQPKIDRVYHVQLCDENGVVYADCHKTVHIRKNAVH